MAPSYDFSDKEAGGHGILLCTLELGVEACSAGARCRGSTSSAGARPARVALRVWLRLRAMLATSRRATPRAREIPSGAPGENNLHGVGDTVSPVRGTPERRGNRKRNARYPGCGEAEPEAERGRGTSGKPQARGAARPTVHLPDVVTRKEYGGRGATVRSLEPQRWSAPPRALGRLPHVPAPRRPRHAGRSGRTAHVRTLIAVRTVDATPRSCLPVCLTAG